MSHAHQAILAGSIVLGFSLATAGEVVLDTTFTLNWQDPSRDISAQLRHGPVGVLIGAGSWGNETIDNISLFADGTGTSVKIIIGPDTWYTSNGYKPIRLPGELLTPPFRGKTYRLYQRGGDMVDVTLVDYRGDRTNYFSWITFRVLATAEDVRPKPKPPPATRPSSPRRCPECSRSIQASNDFCGSCGHALGQPATRSCPSCSKSNANANTFCWSCGARLVAGHAALSDPLVYDRVLIFDGNRSMSAAPEARFYLSAKGEQHTFLISAYGFSRADDPQWKFRSFLIGGDLASPTLALYADKRNKPIGSHALEDFLGGRALAQVGPFKVGMEILDFTLTRKASPYRNHPERSYVETTCTRMVCRVVFFVNEGGGEEIRQSLRGMESMSFADYYRRHRDQLRRSYSARCRRSGLPEWSPPNSRSQHVPRDYVTALKAKGFWGMVDEMFEDAAIVGSWSNPKR